jgi:HAD superfamily hydrolase (TIGR01450 family)
LVDGYDVAMLDLDGVVYVGGAAVSGAAEAIASARAAGMAIAFITNNASRSSEATARHLVDLGVEARAGDVVSSAQAAAHLLRERFGAGQPIAVLGAEGLQTALDEVGLRPVAVDEQAVALVSGYGPEVPWRDIMRAATRVRDGLPWFACNTDATIPAAYGVAPGHGVLVDLIARFSGVKPVVAGKPARPLLDETIRRTGAKHPLMVGDRLDTDIAGAVNIGIDSLLVMTGVTGIHELASARPQERPTYIGVDLGALLETIAPVECDGGTSRAGGWEAVAAFDGHLAVSGSGSTGDWWRAVAASAWWWLDTTGSPADVSRIKAPEQVASST